MAEKKPLWESVSLSVSAILVPIVVALVGSMYTRAVKNREVEGQFVELAVKILQEEPTEENQPLRSWAVTVMDKYSGVPMGPEVKENLIERESFPARGSVSAVNGLIVRSGPGPSFRIDEVLAPGAVVQWIEGSETFVDGAIWVQLDSGGWVMKDFVSPKG